MKKILKIIGLINPIVSIIVYVIGMILMMAGIIIENTILNTISFIIMGTVILIAIIQFIIIIREDPDNKR